MKTILVALAVIVAMCAMASAEEAIPDLRGVWSGKGQVIVFGSLPHHPGSQTASDPPRVSDVAATHTVEGQQGRVAWGHSSTAAADTKEPFAWAISSDNRSIVGADLDWLLPDHTAHARPDGECATYTTAQAPAARWLRPAT